MTAAKHTPSDVIARRKAYQKAYYSSPIVRARVNARVRKRRELDPEKFRKAAREWHRQNKEKMAAYNKKYMQRPGVKERAAARQRQWTIENREHRVKLARKRSGLPDPTRPCPDVCECCGGRSERSLHLDHCHKTGQFRGWLCFMCNSGIGKLGDDISSLERAVAYLRKNLLVGA